MVRKAACRSAIAAEQPRRANPLTGRMPRDQFADVGEPPEMVWLQHGAPFRSGAGDAPFPIEGLAELPPADQIAFFSPLGDRGLEGERDIRIVQRIVPAILEVLVAQYGQDIIRRGRFRDRRVMMVHP